MKLKTAILKPHAESGFSSQKCQTSTLSLQDRAESASGLSILLILLIKTNTSDHFASSLTAFYYLSFLKDNPGNKIMG